MQLSWKLVPLALLLALGAFVLSSGSDLGDPSKVLAGDGAEKITISVDTDPEDTGPDFDFTLSGPGADCGDAFLNLNDGYSATRECTDEGAETYTASVTSIASGWVLDLIVCNVTDQGSYSTSDSNFTPDVGAGNVDIDVTDNEHVNCRFHFNRVSGSITIIKDAPGGGSLDFEFESAGTSTECDDSSFKLEDNESKEFTCDVPGTYTITEIDRPSGWELDDINCTDEGVPSSDIVIDVGSRDVTITLEDGSDSVTCTFENKLKGTPTPTVSPTPDTGPADKVTVSAAPNLIPLCSGSSFITVVVKNEAGTNVADGTVVTINSTVGSVSPGTATTIGGGVLVVFTAPADAGGTATITATSSTKSGTAQIQLECNVATATSVPTQPPAVIQPPSTGDGGFDREGAGWPTYAVILLAAASFAGTFIIVRRRA